MEEVLLVIKGRTNVWASEHTMSRILAELSTKEREAFMEKLTGCAQNGFATVSDRLVRHEGTDGGGHTWRFAYKNSDLFRVVGFFETDQKKDFIALDAFFKDSGDDYSKAQWNRMKEISQIKLQGDKAWRRKTP